MSVFADTSFLFALYRRQTNSDRALDWLAGASESPILTPLVEFEFEQAVRFEIFLRARDRTKGMTETDALCVLAQFEAHKEQGILKLPGFDLEPVLHEATRISEAHTFRHGYRAFDILHVASSLVLGSTGFLTFDSLQRDLAAKERLALPL